MFSYCIACVKSTVYIFEIEWGDLIASFDSHFGRILVLKCLSTATGGNNYIITTGMDKTTKVWNLQNAREKSITIAQLDKTIEMMHISTETQMILAQTRTQFCLFDMRNGAILGQLSANPHGSIYQCKSSDFDSEHKNQLFDTLKVRLCAQTAYSQHQLSRAILCYGILRNESQVSSRRLRISFNFFSTQLKQW